MKTELIMYHTNFGYNFGLNTEGLIINFYYIQKPSLCKNKKKKAYQSFIMTDCHFKIWSFINISSFTALLLTLY